MQDVAFIPRMGMQPETFWATAHALAEWEQMDRVLAYMFLMRQKAQECGIVLTRQMLLDCGAPIAFFPGVEEWFDKIRAFGRDIGLEVDHYIVSAGIKEMIEGSRIARHFTAIYANEFHYDTCGAADWPRTLINHTGKTQYLFRINKGVVSIADDEGINRAVAPQERPLPIERMIFIGDGLTDVPIMRVTRLNGGRAVAVYTKDEVGRGLLEDGRVDFIAPADYREQSPLYKYVTQALRQIASQCHGQ